MYPQGQQGNYQFQGQPQTQPGTGFGFGGRERGPASYSPEVARSEQSFITKVYGWMCLGLLITFAIAFGLQSRGASLAPLLFPIVIVQLVAAMVLIFGLRKFSAGVATALFVAYSTLTGLLFAVIFAAMEANGTAGAIAPAFLCTAGVFGLMSLIGFVTKRDLTSFGGFLLFALIGVLVGGLVGMLFSATLYTWVFIYGGLFVFMGLTIYDTWRIKNSHRYAEALGPAGERKLAVFGAFQLYLDFINIFIRLLAIFGGGRN